MVNKFIYKRLRLLFCLGIISVLWNCKSNDIAVDKKHTTEISTLETLMEKEAYYIDIEVAFPFSTAATTQVVNAILLPNTGNSAGRIDVSGDGNFIEIQKDSSKGSLPFFGERRLSGGPYGSTDGSISFNGIHENYEKTINEGKRKLEIKFKAIHNGESSESYDVNIEIFPSKRVDVRITPTFRTYMRYTGRLKPVKNESK